MILTRCWSMRMKTFMVVAILANISVLIYLYFMQLWIVDTITTPSDKLLHSFTTQSYHNDSVTLVLYEFENFHNRIENMIYKNAQVLPDVRICVVTEKPLYPPVFIKDNISVTFVSMQVDLHKVGSDIKPENFITTEFVLIVPDGVSIHSQVNIEKGLNILKNNFQPYHSLAIPVYNEKLECYDVIVAIKNWTLQFNKVIDVSHIANDDTKPACGLIKGLHGVLMRREDFLSLPAPFLRPFPDALYIQLAARRWFTYVYSEVPILDGSSSQLFQDPETLWKHRLEDAERRKDMFDLLGIKLVKHVDGTEEWHGCNKRSQRCFGSIVNDVPEFVYARKMTPPCCLHALRETGRHVFKTLERHNVRYWLEGGSLLGAARSGDIIPWDYDIDIGIYRDDIDKCESLLRSTTGAYIDSDGYKWEKAIEGDFYRVQYSESNHMHVDIFPFHVRDGIMTKNTWFETHRQDMEFPQHYLQPLTKVDFIGHMASAPNNVRQFLELKFGAGVIENPKYPNGDSAS